MYRLQQFKQKWFALWILIGLSLSFGYETQAQYVSVPSVELVEASITAESRPTTVSYARILKAYIASFYTSSYTTFSFTQFVKKQHTVIQQKLAVQEKVALQTESTFIKMYTLLCRSLSDHTDDTSEVLI